MSKSIRYYYFTSIAAVLVASVLVMTLIQVYTTMNYFRTDRTNSLSGLVSAVQDDVADGRLDLGDMGGYNFEALFRIAESEMFLMDSEGMVIMSSMQALKAVSAALDMEGPVQIPAVMRERLEGLDGEYSDVGNFGGFFGRKHYSAARRLTYNGELVGFVVAFSDATSINGYVADMLSNFILSAGLVLLVASMLAVVLANRTVIPIRRVSNTARRFGEGDYTARVPVEGDDELAQLAMTFNEMAASCEATDISRRSFMGNIAHELRTPMTSIKGFIDGMLDGTIPLENRDKYLKIVSEEVGRLSRLTQNMLDISKLEAGENEPNTTSFDMWEPVTSVVLSAEQRLQEKQVDVRGLEDIRPIHVLADEDYVHQVVYNLVDNAIKFVDDAGTITVAVAQGKGYVTTTIHNTGAGIPAEALPYIFDRFYKADQSRGLNAAGSGLGLHICKVLVSLMGGRIWAESEENEWTAFKFTLPAAPQKRPGVRWSEGRIKQETDDE